MVRVTLLGLISIGFVSCAGPGGTGTTTTTAAPTVLTSQSCTTALDSGQPYAYCYEMAQDNPPPNSGEAIQLSSPANAGVVNANTDHVIQDLWEGTDNAACVYWVEAGWGIGNLGNFSTSTPEFFWADNRPSHGSKSHAISSPTANFITEYPDSIQYTGNNTWTIYLDGTQNVSIDNPPDTTSGWITGQNFTGWYDGYNSPCSN